MRARRRRPQGVSGRGRIYLTVDEPALDEDRFPARVFTAALVGVLALLILALAAGLQSAGRLPTPGAKAALFLLAATHFLLRRRFRHWFGLIVSAFASRAL